MVQHHHWNLEDLETLLPWERYVYVQMLHNYLKDEAEQRQLQQNKQRDNRKHTR
jgi:hypothetical protein